MAVSQLVNYNNLPVAGNAATATAGRGQSYALWADCPREQIRSDFNAGYFSSDDFLHGLNGTSAGYGWVKNVLESGTVASLNAENGVIQLASIGNAGSGAQLQRTDSATTSASIATQTSGKLWFECRVKLTAATMTKVAAAIGLATRVATVMTDSGNGVEVTLTATDFIGFTELTTASTVSAGNLKGTACATTASHSTALHTPVTAEWVKLGFKVTNDDLVEFYVDGVKQDQTITTHIPSGASALMVPTFSIVTLGDAVATLDVDWYDCVVSQQAL